jgi:hypothetical protein
MRIVVAVYRSAPASPVRRAAAVLACAVQLAASTANSAPTDVRNPTGLPIYPNLTSARMEDRLRTDYFGHWCMHVSATTSDSLSAVEQWYRRALRSASETDLRRDGAYGDGADLDGIKLSVNIDSIAVYKTSQGATTSIDLTRCSPGP